MHMADALLSPTVGAAFWGVSVWALGRAARRVRATPGDDRLALMGVAGAFVFAAQMINFAVPGTGSSGHFSGALLLALLLGPHAALLTVAAVLAVQALLFADGGLLAYGANVFNLGVLPCLLIYPPLARAWGAAPGPARWQRRHTLLIVAAALLSAGLGALAVVAQTSASGLAALPASLFLSLLLPIQLALGLAEALATVAIVRAALRLEPALFAHLAQATARPPVRRWQRLQRAALVGVVLTAGGLSWMASDRPDGLEWSVAQAATDQANRPGLQSDTHRALAAAQAALAPLPDYAPPPRDSAAPTTAPAPAVTALAGLVGGTVTLLLIGVLAWWLGRSR